MKVADRVGEGRDARESQTDLPSVPGAGHMRGGSGKLAASGRGAIGR